jgi:hypothetical protein
MCAAHHLIGGGEYIRSFWCDPQLRAADCSRHMLLHLKRYGHQWTRLRKHFLGPASVRALAARTFCGLQPAITLPLDRFGRAIDVLRSGCNDTLGSAQPEKIIFVV